MVSEYFWKKKTIISYFLAIFVFWIHISSFAHYEFDGSTFAKINLAVNIICTKLYTPIAVPLFFILASTTFFRDYTPSKFKDKLKGRIRTLAIPYLLWNILFTAFDIVTSYSFVSKYFLAREKYVVSLYNILMSVFLYRSGPFWFIFCLLVFMTASPVIYAVLRKKYVGFASIGIILLLDVFGIGLPKFFFFSRESIIFYLIGAMIGIHYMDWFVAKASKKQLLFGGIAFVAFTLYRYEICVHGMKINVAFDVILTAMCGVSIWHLMDLVIDKMKESSFMHHSFMVYAMHINISAVIAKVIYLVAPKDVAMAIPNFAATTILTLLAIEWSCLFLRRYMANLYMLLSGGRV